MITILQQIDQGHLWKFHGGIHPPGRKEATQDKAITSVPMPAQLVLSIQQHIGAPGRLQVAVGDKVDKGQLLASAEGFVSAAIHAPTSGTISAIEPRPAAHPSGLPTLSVVLEPDGEDRWRARKPLDIADNFDKEAILTRIRDAGITGLGGASFPASVKLSAQKPIEYLVLNGAECEPYITADDRLMRERADGILRGAEIMAGLLHPKRILIAIEDNKPQAIDAMERAAETLNIDIPVLVRAIPTLYPAGGEKQLIEVLTSKQVPSGGLPSDVGVVMQNVATSYAIAQAIDEDQPLINRIITLTGDLVRQPGNYEIPIGMTVADLLAVGGFRPEHNQKLIMGGPMMGFALQTDQAPLVKASNCIIAASDRELPPAPKEQPCIRCGECANVCPSRLLPQQLLWHAQDKNHDKLEAYDLKDCIECGACAFVCPSTIPLVEYYRVAKAEIREEKLATEKAERAKERFEQRNARLERDKQERQERQKKAAEARRQAMADKNNGETDAVAAALARVKAKKAATATTDAPAAPASTNTATADQDKVAAAIARAKAKRTGGDTATPDNSEMRQLREERKRQARANKAPQTEEDSAVTPEQDKKSQVAAAIARAKAKRAAQTDPDNEITSEASVEPSAVSADDDKKARVAAAVARAKAKRAAQADPDNETAVEPAAVSADDDKKARVAAAVARAKAKRAAKADPDDETTSESTPEPSAESAAVSADDDKKARVAAAVARAKAKRAAKTDPDGESTSGSTPEPSAESAAVSTDDDKKARVAAAVAKAKAKRAAKADPDGETTSESTPEPSAEPAAVSADDDKKARVAAAVARAKAKRAAKADPDDETTSESTPEPTPEPAAETAAVSADDEKKARIAAAVAKAKAKRAAQQTSSHKQQSED